MNKPGCKVLVVGRDAVWLREAIKGLNHNAHQESGAFGLSFVPAASAADAQAAVRDDGSIQIVLIDSQDLDQPLLPFVDWLGDFRPELSLYVLLGRGEERAQVANLLGETLSGYFMRDEQDWAGWRHILQAEIAEKAATPFFDALKRYVELAKDSWHTPGHSGGDSLRGSPWVGDFYQFLGENTLRADLSVSVPMLDSLLHPAGVINDAQALAAQAFGARRTYFATNGSSTANKVILQTLLAPGDTLLLDRNCHKSVHHATILSGARPVYLESTLNRRYGLFGPVPKQTILDALAVHPSARVLILTSSTYDGLCYDLAPIIAAAHECGVKVVVDEAWYGFARFHPAMRPTALECGADYVTQSTHKVLSALSQASMIHVNDPAFDAHLFRENFNMHASTSPQYSIIASLDVARKQAMMEGYTLIDRALGIARELRELIAGTGVFRVLELDDLLPAELANDAIRLDPTKLTIDISDSGYSGAELRDILLERFNIQVEKTTFNTLTLLVTIGTTRSKASRLLDALLRVARDKRTPRRPPQLPALPGLGRLVCLPRDAFYEAGEMLPLLDDDGRPNSELAGRVACDQVTPYPPGIPVWTPGQQISDEAVSYLGRVARMQKDLELHGVEQDGDGYYVRVLRLEDEQMLKFDRNAR